MNHRLLVAVVLGFAIISAARSQDASVPPSGAGQQGGGRGQRGAMGGMMGRGVTGTVTEVAADHYTVKTATGENYTIHYSANTRFMKQTAGAGGGVNGQGNGAGWRGQRNGQNGPPADGQAGGSGGRMMGGNPPQQIKSTDIKVGDAVAAMGEVDATAKSVGAVAVLELDPQRAKQMQEMEADYGKTWLMGKVTAINDVQVTLQGSVDNAPHTFVADENTTFRERNNPVTLADIHNDDTLRVEGSVKNGVFTATTVNVMRMPDGPRGPRNGGNAAAPGNVAPPQ